MSVQVQFRRGTATEHTTFTGAVGEITVDTTDKRAVVHDGTTAGGSPLAKESEIPAGANPTGTAGLSAVNGSASTFLRSDGAPALSQAIAPVWTGNHRWSASGSAGVAVDPTSETETQVGGSDITIGASHSSYTWLQSWNSLPLKINPSGNSTLVGPSSYSTSATSTPPILGVLYSISGTQSSAWNYVTLPADTGGASIVHPGALFNTSADTMNGGAGWVNGVTVNHNFGNSSTGYGGRQALCVTLTQTAATNSSNTNRNYVGGICAVNSSSGDGGTNTGAGALGAYFGFAAVGTLSSGATNVSNLSGGEINVAAKTGSSVGYKSGLQITGTPLNAVAAATYDTLLGLSDQTGSVGFNHAILIGNMNSAHPVKSSGTLIGTTGSSTVTYGIDISSYTFSTAAFKSTGFTVDGSGLISSLAHTVTSASANALAVGRQGTTNPALQIDASTASSATGLKVKAAAAAGGLAVSVITSGTNENLTIDAAGSGTITLGGTSTGAITLTRATTLSAALTYGGVTLSNAVTGTGKMVLDTSPTIDTAVAKGTWTASGTWTIPAVTLGGAVSGNSQNISSLGTIGSGAITVTSTSASAITVGRQGATDPVLKIDASTASVATGISITGAAAAGGVALAAISSGTNEALKIDAKGSGTITLGGTSTGAITLTRATTLSAALTYGGVTLSNAVTGTGNMVLSAGPTLTGTLAAAKATFTSTGTSVTFSTGANQDFLVGQWGGDGSYGGLSMNGTLAAGSMSGFFGGNSGDNVLYIVGPGNIVFRPTGSSSNTFQFSTTSLVVNAGLEIYSGTAIPAGGSNGAGVKFSSTANFGLFFGSGAPTLSAAKGSIYMRSDGSSTTTRAYVNTDGSTTWTYLTAGA